MFEVLLFGSAITLLVSLIAQRSSQKTRRRGVLNLKVSWWGERGGWVSAIVTVIVEERDVVASQSKVKILHIDDAPNPSAVKEVKKKIGDWYATDEIEWTQAGASDPEIEALKEKLKNDQVIKTPLKDLVAKIEQDEIETV